MFQQGALPFDYFGRTMQAGTATMAGLSGQAGIYDSQARMAEAQARQAMDQQRLELERQRLALLGREVDARYGSPSFGQGLGATIGAGLAGFGIGSAIEGSGRFATGGNYGLLGAGLGAVAGFAGSFF